MLLSQVQTLDSVSFTVEDSVWVRDIPTARPPRVREAGQQALADAHAVGPELVGGPAFLQSALMDDSAHGMNC